MVLHKFLEPVAKVLVLLQSFGVHHARRVVQRLDIDLLQPFRLKKIAHRRILFEAYQIELRSKEKWGWIILHEKSSK